MRSGFLLLFIAVSACSGSFRTYDGVLGFRMEAQQAGMLALYTDLMSVDRTKQEELLVKGCADHFGVSANDVQLKDLSETSSVANVVIRVPRGAQTPLIGDMTYGLGALEADISVQNIVDEMDVRTLSAQCQIRNQDAG